jgi:hypothetical protein
MTDYLSHCESHLQNLISATSQTGGAMWPSMLDTRTRGFPEGDHVPKRVYRLIGAPRGSTLYWDQPMVVAANALSELTGDRQYRQAADRYVDAFLSRCVADDGMFLWGNHCYYDVFEGRIVSFSNGHHELRPISPAWDVFWRHAPERTESYIRAMAGRHVYDPATGAFNRHDNGKKGHAFLEAGGILTESLAWLHGRTGAPELLKTALIIARYSYNHRDPSTGLVPNEPDQNRWDSKVCTSEIGLWARCLLRAQACTGDDELGEMARNALRAYLDYAYDDESGRYFGQVDIHNGKAVVPEQIGYWPGKYSDLWNTDQWPTHDYPASAAEACLSLYRRDGDRAFPADVRRWARIAVETSPGRTGMWSYAGNYGRCIHFLTRAGLELKDDRMLHSARCLAYEAVDRLWENGLFQGFPGSHVYESVDGVGFLIQALMFLQSRKEER